MNLKNMFGMAAVAGAGYFLEPILGKVGAKIATQTGSGFLSRMGSSLAGTDDKPSTISMPGVPSTSRVGESPQERNYRALQGLDYLKKLNNSTYVLGRDNWSTLMGAVQINNTLPSLGSREVSASTTTGSPTTSLATTARGY